MNRSRLLLILSLAVVAFLSTALMQRFETPRGIFQLPGGFPSLLKPDQRGPGTYQMKEIAGLISSGDQQILDSALAATQQAIVQPVADEFSLIFPHAPAGRGAGLDIQASVFLLNNSGANCQGTIFYYTADGSPRSVSTNLGIGSQFQFALGPGEELRVETNESGDVTNGWVEVVSDVLLSGSGTFTVLQGGSFVSEVGIADSQRSKRSLLFVDTTDGKGTGFAICNPDGASDLNFRARLMRLDGTEVVSTDGLLGPRGQTAKFVRELFPSAGLNNFKGVLIVSSESTEFSIVTLRTRGLFFTSFPTAPRVEDTSEEGSLTFARIADGTAGSLKIFNTFLLMNNSDEEAMATLRFFDAAGQPLSLRIGSDSSSELEVTVPSNNSVELISSGEGALAVGSARVESTIPLAGGAAFTIVDSSDGSFQAEVGISDSTASRRLTIFAQVEGDIDTGIGLTNIQENPVTARFRLVGNPTGSNTVAASANGKTTAIDVTADILLQPGEAVARFVSEIFPQVEAIQQRSFVGRLEITGLDVPISEALGYPIELDLAGVTLRSRGARLTSLPTAPYVVNFNPVLSVELATDLEGSSPRTCFSLRQDVQERGVRRATIQLDSGRVDFSQLTADTQIIGDLIAMVPLFGVTSHSRIFATDVTTDKAFFYSPISISDTGEVVPFRGTLRNLPGGGFEFETISNPPDTDPASLVLPGLNRFCFDAGIIQLPDAAGTEIKVQQEYMSMQTMAGSMDTLLRSLTSHLTTSGLDPGVPRIESVSPGRVLGGSTIEINGQGFSSVPANNVVTVEGNSRVKAEVTKADPNQLTVELPSGVAQGDLIVENAGAESNTYALAVTFAPLLSITVSSTTAGQATALGFNLTQKPGELSYEELVIAPDGGEWITSGFSPDQDIGRIVLNTLLDVPNTPFDETTTLRLRVASSDTDSLTVNAYEEDEEDPTFVIEIDRQGAFRLTPFELGTPTALPFDFELEAEFEMPIFQLPAAPSAVNFQSDLISQPERIGRPVTRRKITLNQSIELS